MSHTPQQLADLKRASQEIHEFLVMTYPDVGKTAEATWIVTNALIRNAAILLVLGVRAEEVPSVIDRMATRMKAEIPSIRAFAEQVKRR